MLAFVGGSTYVYCGPLPYDPQQRPTLSGIKLYDRHGRLLYETASAQGSQTYLTFDQIPIYLRQATVATEDSSFYENPGVDPFSVGRALLQNLRNGRLVSGGSTISQQLARNLYLSEEERSSRSLWRKLRESILAIRLNRALSKDEILELYLNQTYYGNLAYGVEAAAQVYFGKSARDLDLAEVSLLAGLPQSPSAYDPFTRLEAARDRQRTVLRLMLEAGYITEEEASAATGEPIRLNPTPFPIEAPHFIVYAQDIVQELVGIDAVSKGGLEVYTTLNLDLQREAEAAIGRRLEELREKGASNAALVALDAHTGQILVMVGSADYFDARIDGAVNVALSPRQPGSALKPILYAAALDSGFTAATPLFDVETAFTTRQGELYIPNNYDGRYHGIIPLRRALASSYNVPAVQVLRSVGLDRFLDLAEGVGITTLRDRKRYDLSLTLGGGEVTLLELTGTYAAFASGGLKREPAAILSIEDAEGRVLYDWQQPEPKRVLDERVAYLITDILSDNTARMPAFGDSSPLLLSRPAAAKTGTTTDWRDNWTVGYTPDLVTGVWVGNSDNRPMRRVSGVTGAGPIWHDFMEAALRTAPPRPFPRPDGLVQVEVCSPMGQLPGPYCQERRRELFIAGTEPREEDSYYRPLRICLITGDLADPSCPPDQVAERVFAFPPPEVIPWAREAGLLLPPVPPYHDGSMPTNDAASLAEDHRPAVGLAGVAPDLVLRWSPELPADAQALPLEAVVSGFAAEWVRLFDNEELVAISSDAPFRFLWPLREGNHTLQVRARGADGRETASEPVTVTVEPP